MAGLGALIEDADEGEARDGKGDSMSDGGKARPGSRAAQTGRSFREERSKYKGILRPESATGPKQRQGPKRPMGKNGPLVITPGMPEPQKRAIKRRQLNKRGKVDRSRERAWNRGSDATTGNTYVSPLAAQTRAEHAERWGEG